MQKVDLDMYRFYQESVCLSVCVVNAVQKSAAYGKWSIGELMGAGTCNNICFGNWAGAEVQGRSHRTASWVLSCSELVNTCGFC